MKWTFVSLLLLASVALSAQADPSLFLGLIEISTADRTAINTADLTKGMMVIDSDLDQVFYFDGTQWIGIKKSRTVTSELFFEDNDYCYISMAINTTDYKVTRYEKADLNAEAASTGTGAQPTTLAAVQALTYN